MVMVRPCGKTTPTSPQPASQPHCGPQSNAKSQTNASNESSIRQLRMLRTFLRQALSWRKLAHQSQLFLFSLLCSGRSCVVSCRVVPPAVRRACVRACGSGRCRLCGSLYDTGALSVSLFTHTQRILHKPIDCILLRYLWLCMLY